MVIVGSSVHREVTYDAAAAALTNDANCNHSYQTANKFQCQGGSWVASSVYNMCTYFYYDVPVFGSQNKYIYIPKLYFLS